MTSGGYPIGGRRRSVDVVDEGDLGSFEQLRSHSRVTAFRVENSSDDAIPQSSRQRRLHHAGALEPDVSATMMLEQFDAVAQHDRSNQHEHLVEQAGLYALARDAGTQDVHVFVPCCGFGSRDSAGQIGDESNARYRGVGYPMGEHELRPTPSAAKRLAFLLGALVRVVTAECPVADEQCADLADQLVHL